MSFEEFIVKYYGWVLAILLILIVTIIGFIADKKIKKKKEGNEMNEQNMQNNQFMGNTNDMNAMPNLNTASPAMDASMGQSMSMPNMSAFNQPEMQMPNTTPVMPAEPVASPMPASDGGLNYTPLSEQTPNIPPRFEGMPTFDAQPNVVPTAVNNNFQEFNTPVQPAVAPVVEPVSPAPSVAMPTTNGPVPYSVPPVEAAPTPVVEPIQSINPQPIPLTEQPVVSPVAPVMGVNDVNQAVNPLPQTSMQQPVNNVSPNPTVDVNNMFVTGNQMPNATNPTNTNPWQ